MADTAAVGVASKADPVVHVVSSKPSPTYFANCREAALYWYDDFGVRPFPVLPGYQVPAVEPVIWFNGLSSKKIADYWDQNPGHNIGIFPGNNILVLSTLDEQGSKALGALELSSKALPHVVFKVGDGVVHLFRISEKNCAQFTMTDILVNGETIKIQTGQTCVLLPPSRGRKIMLNQAKHVTNLTEASQTLIAALCNNNGIQEPVAPVIEIAAETFPCCAAEDITIEEKIADQEEATPTALSKFSLTGSSGEIEKQVIEQVPFLGEFALLGQLTALYGPPNSGKTVIALAETKNAIRDGRIKASNVYYIDVDDNSKGILEKLTLAEEYGYQMLAEGHRGFSASAFPGIFYELIESDQASGMVVILDTLKKFTDLMDKTKASNFNKLARRFVAKGGTLIGLAHTNKNLRNGKPVYGGTSDVVDDFDCAYILAPLPLDADSDSKIVMFENIKRRGDVVQSIAYSYSVAQGISYDELIASVQTVDAKLLAPLQQAAQVRSDAEVISVVANCIRQGINTKMRLAEAVAERAIISNRAAIQVIERYTGDDPAVHNWRYSVRERGSKVFILLDTKAIRQGGAHD
jgi:hypothetical protein